MNSASLVSLLHCCNIMMKTFAVLIAQCAPQFSGKKSR
jgi:hypothetical protein